MVRVKHGVTTRKRHNKILKETKGYRGLRNKLFRLAKNAWMKAGLHSYVGRKNKKRDFRRLWIARISAALKPLGFKYSRFVFQLEANHVLLNRKVLADVAAQHPGVFTAIASDVMDGVAPAAAPAKKEAPKAEAAKAEVEVAEAPEAPETEEAPEA